MKYYFFLLLFVFTLFGFAQEKQANRFIVTDKVETILAEKADCLAENSNLNYYHVQLYNGHSNQNANNIKQKFNSIFPSVFSIVEWESPEFKVWVGEYETKLVADKALIIIRKKFPNAFIVNPKKK